MGTNKEKKSSDEAYALDRSMILKLDKDDTYILKSLLYGEKDNRKELFDFFARGKVTKVPMRVMVYMMAYLLKFNSTGLIGVDISTIEDKKDSEPNEDEKDSEPEYYLTVRLIETASI